MRNPYLYTSNTDASVTTEWKPAPWIAAAISLFATPLGMLYVQRPLLALFYLIASVSAGLAAYFSIWALGSLPLSMALTVTSWVVAIACAVHSFRIARSTSPLTERKWYSRWYGLAALSLSVFLIFFVARSFAYEPFRVPSQSMHPTIPEDSLVLVRKAGFGHYGTYGIPLWRDEVTETIRRGDIVVHELVKDPGTNYVSRVIALPGDHIQYVNRRLVINGQSIPTRIGEQEGMYQYAVERLDDRDVTIAFILERPSKEMDAVVPRDHYVMFGDNRDNARDSRYIGFVPRRNVVGRVEKIFPAAELL